MAIYKEEIQNQYSRIPMEYRRNNDFSLKEIGMLTVLYSLPEKWDYTHQGLTKIVKEGISSIRATFGKLEKKGYISAPKVRGPDGKFAGSDLYMYITPKTENDPSAENPHVEKPMTDNPPEDKPHQEKPHAEHHRESKSKESIIKESNNKRSMNQRYSGYQGSRKAPYNNFPQREYDFEVLERELFRTQGMAGGDDVCAK